MQRLRLTENFAIEFGDIIAWSLYTGNDEAKKQLSAPLHILPTNNAVYLLNSDGSKTNNVREISAIDKNVTYQVFLTRSPQCYTDVLMQNFDDCKFQTLSSDNLQYIKCKLYSVAGYKWQNDIAAINLELSMTIQGIKYVLRNLSLLKTHPNQYQFKPVASKSVVLDNEQFTNFIEFDIVDMSYVASIQTDTMRQLRSILFNSVNPLAITANIDVAISFVYTDDVYEFAAPLYGQTQLWSFNEFSLRSIKRVPLLSGDSNNGLYAKTTFVQGSEYSNAYIEMSMNHRAMQLETFIAQQQAIDSVAIQYDVITQAYNTAGEVISSASSHMQLQNAGNALSPLQYIPIIKDSPNAEFKPEMCMVYVTAILTMQNEMGDIRFSRSTQLILNKEQIRHLCWLQQPNIKFDTHDIIHKVVVQKSQVQPIGTNAKDRVLQIKVPEYIHTTQLIVNDEYVSNMSTQTIKCAKNAIYNIALQLINESNNTIDIPNTVAFIAKSGKGIIKDALQRSSNMLEFALANNEGSTTTWDIMSNDGKQIYQIILQA